MVRNPNIIILLHKEDKTMTNQVPKTDGRGFPSGAYLNQNHPYGSNSVVGGYLP